MTREQRWELRYAKDGVEKTCHPRSQEKLSEGIAKCKQYGYTYKVTKLYPFNVEKNQHNFFLVSNICFNRMHDMESGEIPFDTAEYDRLDDLGTKAEECMSIGNYGYPIAWIPYPMWKDCKDISEMAINHRIGVCIENGRTDLIKYAN